MLSPVQGTARADSVDASDAKEPWEFFNKTPYDIPRQVANRRLNTLLFSNALLPGERRCTPVHYWNWVDSEQTPYFLNLSPDNNRISLPEGISETATFKNEGYFTCEALSNIQGIRLDRGQARIIDSVLNVMWERPELQNSVPYQFFPYKYKDYYIIGKVNISDNFDSFLLFCNTYGSPTEMDYYESCYILNCRSGHLLSVAQLANDGAGIDASIRLLGYLLGDGIVIVQEPLGYTDWLSYEISVTPPESKVEFPVNYYIYQISDDGTVHQLLPPGVAEGEDKQS